MKKRLRNLPLKLSTLLLLSAVPLCQAEERQLLEKIEWSQSWVADANKTNATRVLMIGDSITVGYYDEVARRLEGEATCAKFATSMYLGNPDFLSEIRILLNRYAFSVIHVNNGLHGRDYSEADYAAQLSKLISLLKKKAPKARIIWAMSTPVRMAGDLDKFEQPMTARVVERNRAAAEIMRKMNIPVNDLFALVKDRKDFFSGDGTHFSAEGKSAQAAQVAECIRAQLNCPANPLAPKPFGPLPSKRQLAWHDMQFYGFIHFTVNTFTDKEWGYGDESEEVFNPSGFDASQIARVAKAGGMAGLILTAKHHDGFCLWPSQYTEHSVTNSPWRNGRGDVVRELSDACRKEGLKFGVYLSPWDRNHKDYARPEYVTYYRNQLRELLTGYGELFAVWFDGANGGDGFYGGARETRKIDNRVYYDWPNTWSIVRELQPNASMFSDAGPDFRWVGNEAGVAGDPCWATLDMQDRHPGGRSAGLNSGERPGTQWLPAECDVSIRPGWFYHAAEDDQVKTPAQLVDIFYKSVGRGACLNLNLPPDRRGRIPDKDAESLAGMRKWLEATFEKNVAKDASLNASNVRAKSRAFAPGTLLDNDVKTYWTCDDTILTPELVLRFSKPVTFNVVDIREFLPLGQRVEAFAMDQWVDGQWRECAKGTSIGNRRLLRIAPVSTTQVRLRITQAPVCPALSEFGLYLEPKGFL